MADVDEAFAALQQLDEKGLTALRLAGAMSQETMRETAARVARAEWRLGRLHKWAADWGLIFDVSRAAAHWDAQHESQPPVLGSRCQVLLAEQGQELRDLRMRLDEALDGREQAEIRAEKAERAPTGVNALLRGGGS